jgi:hypothetical protein
MINMITSKEMDTYRASAENNTVASKKSGRGLEFIDFHHMGVAHSRRHISNAYDMV